MSFTSFNDKPLRTKEEVARVIHQVSLTRGLDKLATVLAVMCVAQEAGANDKNGERQFWCPANPTHWPDSLNYPHDSTSDDGRSSGYFQQQPGPNGEPWWGSTADMMTLERAANSFLDRLSDDYVSVTNAQQANDFIQRVQGSGVPWAYAQWWDLAHQVVDAALASAPAAPSGSVLAPALTVKNVIGDPNYSIYNNSQSRNGRTVDMFIGHTTEGAGGESLVRFMEGAEVSYHVLVDNDVDGNTVWNLVDKNRASWSVLDANNRSINYVIGRSKAAWTRQEWIDNARNAVRIMAYLMVQDAKARNQPLRIQAPPYNADPPCLTDHAYVTRWLGIGTHTDLGSNFIWDLFAQDVNGFANGGIMPADPNSITLYEGADWPGGELHVTETNPVVNRLGWDLLRVQDGVDFNKNGDGKSTKLGLRDSVRRLIFEATLWVARRSYTDLTGKRGNRDTVLGHAVDAASYGDINNQILLKIAEKVGADVSDITKGK